MTQEQFLSSPRLQTLQEALDAGDAVAIDSFWFDIQVQGTPLIEQVEDKTG